MSHAVDNREIHTIAVTVHVVFKFPCAAVSKTSREDSCPVGLQLAGFPSNGALSLEYEENEKDPLADIRQCVAVAKAGMKAAQKTN